MSILKKPIKFVSATCPKCKGNLQLDNSLEVAFCQYCGTQCIVENAPKREKKEKNLEIVLGFVERQQAQRKQEAQARERKEEELRRQKKEERRARREKGRNFIERNWKILTVIGVCVIALALVLNLLK